MPLVPCKCPQCGGELNVDNSKDAAICEYCNTPFIIEKAITTYNTTINNNFAGANITVTGEDLNNLYVLARRAKDTNNVSDAIKYYEKITLQNPNDWEAFFYISYLKASIVSINEMPYSARNYRNILTTTMQLIYDSNLTQEEKENVVLEVYSFSLPLFNLYRNNANDYYQKIKCILMTTLHLIYYGRHHKIHLEHVLHLETL